MRMSPRYTSYTLSSALFPHQNAFVSNDPPLHHSLNRTTDRSLAEIILVWKPQTHIYTYSEHLLVPRFLLLRHGPTETLWIKHGVIPEVDGIA